MSACATEYRPTSCWETRSSCCFWRGQGGELLLCLGLRALQLLRLLGRAAPAGPLPSGASRRATCWRSAFAFARSALNCACRSCRAASDFFRSASAWVLKVGQLRVNGAVLLRLQVGEPLLDVLVGKALLLQARLLGVQLRGHGGAQLGSPGRWTLASMLDCRSCLCLSMSASWPWIWSICCVLLLQPGLGLLLHLREELAFRGDGGGVLPGGLRFPALEKEVQDAEPQRPGRRGPRR